MELLPNSGFLYTNIPGARHLCGSTPFARHARLARLVTCGQFLRRQATARRWSVSWIKQAHVHCVGFLDSLTRFVWKVRAFRVRSAACVGVSKRRDRCRLHVLPQSLDAVCPVVLAQQEIHAESLVSEKEKRVLRLEVQESPEHITSDERGHWRRATSWATKSFNMSEPAESGPICSFGATEVTRSHVGGQIPGSDIPELRHQRCAWLESLQHSGFDLREPSVIRNLIKKGVIGPVYLDSY